MGLKKWIACGALGSWLVWGLSLSPAYGGWLDRPKRAIPGSSDAPETLSAEAAASEAGPKAAGQAQAEVPETLSAETDDDLAIPVAQPTQVKSGDPAPGKEDPPATLSAAQAAEEPVAPSTDIVPTEMGEDASQSGERSGQPVLVGDGYFNAGQADRLWYGRLDYLYWEASDPKRNANVFVTNSTDNTSPNFNNRINLSDPNTDHEMGLRFWVGRKLGDWFGVEVAGLWVYPTDYLEAFTAGIQSGGIFGGNVLNTVTFAPTGEPADFANMSFRSRYWGTELNGRWMALDGTMFDLDLVAGARYLDYAERLAFEYQLASAQAAVTERFETNNNMIGGQIGGDLRAYLCQYVALFGTTRAGLLGNIQDVNVKGPAPGLGRLTNTSNLGVTDDSNLSVLLECNLGLEFLLTPDISFVAGYSGIWLNHQLRAVEQVDLVNAVPGGNPTVSLETDSLWLQGFTFAFMAQW